MRERLFAGVALCGICLSCCCLPAIAEERACVIAKSDSEDWGRFEVVGTDRSDRQILTREAIWRAESPPERIRHVQAGIEFRLVPSGEYTIGNPRLEDSEHVTVTLKAYYVSTGQLTWRQAAACARQFVYGTPERSEEAIPRLRPAQEGERGNDSREQMLGCFKRQMDALELLSGQYDFQSYAEHVLPAVEMLNEQLKSPSELCQTDIERLQVATGFCNQVLENVASRGDAVYDQAFYETADRFARSCGFELPSEAQWEVIAQLTERGKVDDVVGLGDSVLEWCGDFYRHDYFSRESDFDDPIGPSVGSLSPTQRETYAEDSALPFRVDILARRLRVLRGRGMSERSFGLSYTETFELLLKPPPSNRAIRFVLTSPVK